MTTLTNKAKAFGIATVLAAAAAVSSSPALAQARVVALGASNVAGFGVGQSASFPSVLEQMLRQRGIAVQVSNQGISGDTTGGMLSRLDSAVPNGTKVVVLHPGGNDFSQQARQQNVAAITQRLRARGIRVINVQQMVGGALQRYAQADRRHLTIQGHQVIAQQLVGPVSQALR